MTGYRIPVGVGGNGPNESIQQAEYLSVAAIQLCVAVYSCLGSGTYLPAFMQDQDKHTGHVAGHRVSVHVFGWK